MRVALATLAVVLVVAAPAAAAPTRQAAALARSLGPQGIAELDAKSGRPRIVARLDGYLTGRREAAPERIVRDYLTAHADLYGNTESLRLVRSYTARDRVRKLMFEQQAGGVPVLGGGVVASVTTDGRLINVIGAPRPGVRTPPPPVLDATEAAAAAGGSDDTARLVLADGRLAWRLHADGHEVLIDALDGRTLRRRSLVRAARARIFDNRPGAFLGGTQRQVELGAWVSDPGGPELYGPYAYVFADEDDDDEPDAGEDIPSSGGGHYEYTYTPFQNVAGITCPAPAFCSWDRNQAFSWRTNRNQAAVQAFYHANLFHDYTRNNVIDFTPAKGAFEGDKRVWINVADGAALAAGLPDATHRNNAFNYTTNSGYASLTFFLDTDDSRNYGDDAATVYHEYMHGVSSRLMAAPSGEHTLNGHQAESMNEAWSDWYAADLRDVLGYEPDGPEAGDVTIGYLGRSQGIDCAVGPATPGCPGGGYTYGDMGRVTDMPESHADGEIWAETLWDLRRRLIARHGRTNGVDWAQLLVTAGMELSVYEPSFLDMRNAILQADAVYGNRINADLIWSVFAARGMGFFAAAIDSRDVRPVEDFSLPPAANTPTGTLAGTVVTETGVPVPGARVGVAGWGNGAVATTNAEGRWSISDMPAGLYPRLFARAAGGLEVGVAADVRVTGGATTTREIVLRRDWSAYLGGARVTGATGNDDDDTGCGPSMVIDQDASTTWRTDSPAAVPGPKLLTVALPEPVDLTSLELDPSPGCNVGETGMLGNWRLETSRDGVTFTTAVTGSFGRTDGFRRHAFTPAANARHAVRFVRIVGLSTVDSSNPEFTGARWLAVSGLGVYGARADLTAPETTIAGGPAEGALVAVREATLAFSATEPGAAFECRLDGGAWGACSGAAAYSGLGDGRHAFEVRATDPAGNVDPSPAARTWSVDATAPDTVIAAGPAEGATVAARAAVFTFGSEAGAAFECRLDGEAWAACASARQWTGLADGAHAVEVRARDTAGNVDPTPARRAWTVAGPRPTPRATLQVPSQRLGAVRTRGLRVRYVCAASCRVTWELRLTAREARRVRLGSRAVVVGRATSRLRAAGDGTVAIKLTPRAARALRRARQVTFTLRARGGVTATRTIKVRR